MGIVKRTYNKVKKAVKKRYVNKQGIKLVQVAKDVMMLKNVLNPEKKRLEGFYREQFVGQVNIDAPYFFLRDITPYPAVGTGYADRNGASVKLHSSHWRFQFKQLLNTNANVKLKITIFEVKGKPMVQGAELDAWFDRVLQPNPFITNALGTTTPIRDYNSQYNPDAFNTYRIVATKRFTIKNDYLSSQLMIQDVSVGLKYNKGKGHHLRWDKNTQTLTQGQLVMCITADRGNVSINPSTLLNIPDQGAYTGIGFSANRMDYFYDN